jgi:hypothetical protein
MRLGQLARKLNVKPKDIVSFVQLSLNKEIKEHPNAKVPDELLEDIEQFFVSNDDKEKTQQEIPHSNSEEQNNDVEKTAEVKESTELEKQNNKAASNLTSTEPETEENPIKTDNEKIPASNDIPLLTDEDPESEAVEINLVDGIIKAPKVEVPGIKVVGKIDLPEEKKEQEEEEELDVSNENIEPNTSISEDTGNTEAPNAANNKTKQAYPKKKRKRKKPNSLSFEEREKQEKERYEKLQKAKKEREKKKKRKHYETQVLAKQKQVQQKNTKKKKKHSPSKAQIRQEQRPEPKTLWGKFLRWLNT